MIYDIYMAIVLNIVTNFIMNGVDDTIGQQLDI